MTIEADGKEHVLILEMENTRKPEKIYKDKIKKAEKTNFPKDAIVLFLIYAGHSFQRYYHLRPNEQNERVIKRADERTAELVQKSANLPKYRFRFVSSLKYNQIDKKIFHIPGSSQVVGLFQ